MADVEVNGLTLQAIDTGPSVAALAYQALKQAVMRMNIYDSATDLRLDERQLAQDLGVSRTPIRAALARLEQEGLVRTVPRRGTFVVRKTKKELIDIIIVWAALESMAARLLAERASDTDLASLRKLFAAFQNGRLEARLDEYSEANLDFHQRIIELSGCELLSNMADNLRLHMRAIRRRSIGEQERHARSMVDHMHIIEALEQRDADTAERLVRQHALDLATQVNETLPELEE
jgi:DNA-binding GntR family transcriptional regulator